MTCYGIGVNELFVYESPARGEQLFQLTSHGMNGTGRAKLIAEKDNGRWKGINYDSECNFNMYAEVKHLTN